MLRLHRRLQQSVLVGQMDSADILVVAMRYEVTADSRSSVATKCQQVVVEARMVGVAIEDQLVRRCERRVRIRCSRHRHEFVVPAAALWLIAWSLNVESAGRVA